MGSENADQQVAETDARKKDFDKADVGRWILVCVQCFCKAEELN